MTEAKSETETTMVAESSIPSIEAASMGPDDMEHTYDLAAITMDALRIRPPRYIASLLGNPCSWLPPYRRFSEYTALNPWRPLRTAKTLFNWSVPSLPLAPPPLGPELIKALFYQPSVVLQRPDHVSSYTSFPEEHWFFINGILTNDVVAQLNSACLAQLFHRPVTMIQNSTDSLGIDLLQCALGKQWRHMTEPAIVAFPVIYDALVNPHKSRVVVVAHSQGTIILANVLAWLYSVVEAQEQPGEAVGRQPRAKMLRAGGYAPWEIVYPDRSRLDLDDFDRLSLADLRKLEVYCFATCANTMPHFMPAQADSPALPRIEHFANEHDIVARLGMLAPEPTRHEIRIEGPMYVQPKTWGHLLNEHHLFEIERLQRRGRKKGGAGGACPFVLKKGSAPAETTPRLYDYINGGVPA
jgi:hypothetical protein